MSRRRFQNALKYIASIIGQQILDNLVSGFELINENPDIKVKNNGTYSSEYIIINYEKFNIFAKVIKELMADNYDILMENYSFDIFMVE
jgi:hypothetical protein